MRDKTLNPISIWKIPETIRIGKPWNVPYSTPPLDLESMEDFPISSSAVYFLSLQCVFGLSKQALTPQSFNYYLFTKVTLLLRKYVYSRSTPSTSLDPPPDLIQPSRGKDNMDAGRADLSWFFLVVVINFSSIYPREQRPTSCGKVLSIKF